MSFRLAAEGVTRKLLGNFIDICLITVSSLKRMFNYTQTILFFSYLYKSLNRHTCLNKPDIHLRIVCLGKPIKDCPLNLQNKCTYH